MEQGWGDHAGRALDMIQSVLEFLEAPDPAILEKLLGKIPTVFSVVIFSPHGYFG